MTGLLAGVMIVTLASAAGAATPTGRQAAEAAVGVTGITAGVATDRGGPGSARGIPGTAMLQPEDLGGAVTSPVDADRWNALRPPRPCAETNRYGGLPPRRDRAISAMVAVGESPTVVVEWVGSFRANGAQRYLRAAVTNCDDTDQGGGRWTVLSTGTAGAESLLLRLTETFQYAGETMTRNTYLVVVRTGRTVVMVADVGWEISDGQRSLVERLVTPAIQRARTLR
ncbi:MULTISPECIES: hypothetical protein [Catenuloplanes]|uniref:PknH-like extracellular domain-containing protein n=1 Tax=Catenuloplanes niger TaxID=587534 RepID=A0AAE4CT61_9ACTN|nr:hypothetical protein [Catenuloplanes niger]MDR7323082.1 hypothetical protein [Catenuloplanes niger]